MSFAPNARVKVVDQHTDYRKRLGTVLTVPTVGNNMVRLDGFQEGQTVLLTDDQLRATTLACPLTY